MTELGNALAPREESPTRTITSLLEAQRPQIERALPAAFLRRDPDRFVRVVMTELRRNPILMECTPESLLGAMMLSAQLGLEPGPLGHVYLVPFRRKGIREVTFILGYTGLITLAYRAGTLKSIAAHPVYEHEQFKVTGGSAAKIVHEMMTPDDRGLTVKAYYALAKLKTGGEAWKVLYPQEVEARRARSQAKDEGPWKTDYLTMALKSCVKALRPWLPMSAELGRAVALDESPVAWDGVDVNADAESVEDVAPDEERET